MVWLYTLASLNFTLFVSEYGTANVTEKPDTFLCEPNPCLLWSFTCAAVKLSLFQENNLSNGILHRAKCRTESFAVSRNLKMLNIILLKPN